jgi:hypothetical protein
MFTDDDDWIGPEIGKALRRSPLTADATVWRSARFDGSLTVRDPDGFCFTNNYALRGSFLIRSGEEWRLSRQHMDAQDLVHRPGASLRVVDQVLSVTNKHPCSFTTLERAKREGRSVLTLLQPYRDYLHRKRPCDTSPVAWAAPYMDETADWFAGMAVP